MQIGEGEGQKSLMCNCIIQWHNGEQSRKNRKGKDVLARSIFCVMNALHIPFSGEKQMGELLLEDFKQQKKINLRSYYKQ